MRLVLVGELILPWMRLTLAMSWPLLQTVECFLRDLQHSLSDTSEDVQEASARTAPLMASLDWATRKSLFSERWKTERPRLVNNTVEQENVANHICQQCGSNPAAVCCSDCRPSPLFCAECDFIRNTEINLRLSHRCVRLVPVEMPAEICSCSPVSLRVNPGKAVAVVTVNGRHDLSMPELSCDTCHVTWAAGVDNLIRSGYWPATLQFATIYDTDIFHSFEEMKMAVPGLSCQAFLRMLDQRTLRFGRAGKISANSFHKSFFEWEAVRFEVDNIVKEERFICPACSPDMLAVSVDGNRKHYRYKNSARLCRSNDQEKGI
ncbi:uncharacterized protein LOC117545178 isoform X2 [Gymnodraco acuticeps]|uniref:Uncharacterized protein LOC117545178 isoform X2 n=1 Tax=Gymnodraco acuticeps TaxID=8218 RepID=A0A6P8U262_GYMAC|nr:uncharacterized protein LOC117545178 isoform X2 [Gymnodraco acuticeps]